VKLFTSVKKDLKTLEDILEIKVLLESSSKIPFDVEIPFNHTYTTEKYIETNLKEFIKFKLNEEVKKRVVKIPFNIEELKLEFNKILDLEKKLLNGVSIDENIEDLKDDFKEKLNILTKLNSNVNDKIDINLENILEEFSKKIIEYYQKIK